jgi:hypothetical protein
MGVLLNKHDTWCSCPVRVRISLKSCVHTRVEVDQQDFKAFSSALRDKFGARTFLHCYLVIASTKHYRCRYSGPAV